MTTQTEAMKRWVEVFDGNWHDEPVDSEWADRAHQALAEMRQAIAEAEQPKRWVVFCGLCFKEWSVPYQHPGKSVCENCEAAHGITKGNT